MIKLALWCALRDISEVNKTLQDVWPSTGLVYCIYILGSYWLLTEFCRLQNSLCVQVLRSPILEALLHGTRTAAVSHTLWRGTRNGISELSQTAPPIVGRAAITFGIGTLTQLNVMPLCISALYLGVRAQPSHTLNERRRDATRDYQSFCRWCTMGFTPTSQAVGFKWTP